MELYHFITGVNLCTHHHNQYTELFCPLAAPLPWAVVKVLAFHWSNSETPIKEWRAASFLSVEWEAQAPHLVSTDTTGREHFYCQCEWKSQFPTWHLQNYQKSGLLHYILARVEVYTLHSAFAGLTWGGITIFL